MRICVTGGAGFIGQYACTALTAAGQDVTILDLQRPEAPPAGARVVLGDVRHPAAVAAALEGCDAVLHLAAAHHDFGLSEATFYSVNEGSARTLVSGMDAAGIARVCFFSTVAVYGGVPEPRREDGPVAPDSPYGASKLAGERVFAEWTRRGDRRALILRPTVVFGPRNYANMYRLIRQIRSGFFCRIGAGSNRKSLAYVENVIGATLALWNRADAPALDLVNLVDGPDLTSREIADTIALALGRPRPRLTVPLGAALAAAWPFDLAIRATGRDLPISSPRIRKLFATPTVYDGTKALRIAPGLRVPLPEGIERTVRWFVATGGGPAPPPRLPPAAVSTRLLADAPAISGPAE